MEISITVARRATTWDEVWSEIEVQQHNHETVMWDSRYQSLLFGLEGIRGRFRTKHLELMTEPQEKVYSI